MKAIYNKNLDVVEVSDNGVSLLESLYNDIKRPLFIDVIFKMSSKIGSFKKQRNVYIRTNDFCNNLNLLATLNID